MVIGSLKCFCVHSGPVPRYGILWWCPLCPLPFTDTAVHSWLDLLG